MTNSVLRDCLQETIVATCSKDNQHYRKFPLFKLSGILVRVQSGPKVNAFISVLS